MKKLALSTAMIIAATASAGAQEVWPRWYVGLTGGLSHTGDVDYDLSTGTDDDFDTSNGFVGTAALGYRTSEMTRAEVEFSYRNNGESGTDGDITAKNVALNYYIDLGDKSFNPYLGAGVGIARVEVDGAGNSSGVTGSDTVGSYQLMAGFAYSPATMPNTDLVLGYRYFGTMDEPTVGNGTTAEVDYSAHSVEAGVRLNF